MVHRYVLVRVLCIIDPAFLSVEDSPKSTFVRTTLDHRALRRSSAYRWSRLPDPIVNEEEFRTPDMGDKVQEMPGLSLTENRMTKLVSG